MIRLRRVYAWLLAAIAGPVARSMFKDAQQTGRIERIQQIEFVGRSEGGVASFGACHGPFVRGRSRSCSHCPIAVTPGRDLRRTGEAETFLRRDALYTKWWQFTGKCAGSVLVPRGVGKRAFQEMGSLGSDSG